MVLFRSEGWSSRSSFVTHISPNELKLIPSVQKTILYKNVAAIVMDGLVFGSSGAPKLAVLLKCWQCWFWHGVENQLW